MSLVRRAFRASWLTNFGPIHDEFERALSDFLDCEFVLPVTNGTFGLLTILRALGVEGEVITTPYTFPALPHVLFNLDGIRPVFVDVSPHDFNLDPQSVRDAITLETSAIVAAHAYGFPCQVEELQHIADEHGLKLIYDAAPAFGVTCHGKSIASFGDASVFSFHATKVFSTAEGGAIACRDKETYEKCKLFINFGIDGEENIELPGLNGKLDEIRCALGIAGLDVLDETIDRRRQVVEHYLEYFNSADFESISFCRDLFGSDEYQLNYAYFPIVVTPAGALNRDRLYDALRECDIVVRKYYYPTVLDLPMYERLDKRVENVDHAAALSQNTLCLPVNAHFTKADCEHLTARIGECILDVQHGSRWMKSTA
ncbi:MAG: DegT/DnrJ/EryC1/StrS family aminotransferase [Candidatus Hydrogenedentes bacterium]|nr:DegT/DnrJ/EryC1/StrS family aminotransferase [Candidatus Hydrogenedentota bacterium]